MNAAKNRLLLGLFNGNMKRFIIPVYQRQYSWKKENCMQLMKDLKDIHKSNHESHFFGAIVFASKNDGKCEKLTIIDGQQRITTISLLLLAIRNYIRKHEEIELEVTKETIEAYLIDALEKNEKKLKLKLVQGDDNSYEMLLNENNDGDNNIINNYNYFYNELEKMKPEEIDGIYDSMAKLEYVGISLEGNDDPQLIFESMNSTGLALDNTDKVRNFILMGMDYEAQEIFYKKYWEPLEKLVTKSNMDSFIRYYLAIKTRQLFSERELYFKFKDYYYSCETSENEETNKEELLKDMLAYGKYFSIIINPEGEKKAYLEVLKRLDKLQIKTCIPLFMDLFMAKDNNKISDVELDKAFEMIESYIIRREICDLPTNSLNKGFVRLGGEIEKEYSEESSYFDLFKNIMMRKVGRSRFPSDSDMEDKFIMYELYTRKPSIRQYILERLENFGNKEQIAVDKQILTGELTIEHVMPQTLTDDWRKELGPDCEAVHLKYLNTIGNLTLTAYNSEYSNNSFNYKKTLEDKGFLSSKLYLNEYIGQCNSWGEKEIVERAKILLEKAKKIWWIPEMSNVKVDGSAWFEWDSDVDLTNKKVTKVDILGDEIEISGGVIDAYKTINERLYELDSEKYKECNFSWTSDKENNLRSAYKIGNELYIETNNNSNAKLRAIQDLAERFELEPEDIRLFVESRE